MYVCMYIYLYVCVCVCVCLGPYLYATSSDASLLQPILHSFFHSQRLSASTPSLHHQHQRHLSANGSGRGNATRNSHAKGIGYNGGQFGLNAAEEQGSTYAMLAAPHLIGSSHCFSTTPPPPMFILYKKKWVYVSHMCMCVYVYMYI